MNWLFRAVFAAGATAASTSHALACATLNDDSLVSLSDVVVDGTANCDVSRGTCHLVARNVVKDNSWPRDGRRSLYRFRFQPGANERLARAARDEARESGSVSMEMMCVWPWEPRSESVEGRFYLYRHQGRLLARQESARGGPKPDEAEAAE